MAAAASPAKYGSVIEFPRQPFGERIDEAARSIKLASLMTYLKAIGRMLEASDIMSACRFVIDMVENVGFGEWFRYDPQIIKLGKRAPADHFRSLIYLLLKTADRNTGMTMEKWQLHWKQMRAVIHQMMTGYVFPSPGMFATSLKKEYTPKEVKKLRDAAMAALLVYYDEHFVSSLSSPEQEQEPEAPPSPPSPPPSLPELMMSPAQMRGMLIERINSGSFTPPPNIDDEMDPTTYADPIEALQNFSPWELARLI